MQTLVKSLLEERGETFLCSDITMLKNILIATKELKLYRLEIYKKN